MRLNETVKGLRKALGVKVEITVSCEWCERWKGGEDGVRSAWRPRELHKLTETQPQLLPPTLKMAAPFMENLSEYLGSPEPAVRLILSILLGK